MDAHDSEAVMDQRAAAGHGGASGKAAESWTGTRSIEFVLAW